MPDKHPITEKPLAHDGYCRNRNDAGHPDVLWIREECLAITIEDCIQGEGIEYIRRDLVDDYIEREKQKRIQKLLDQTEDAIKKLKEAEDFCGQ